MNFFEHQDRARRHSRRLVLLFILAVVAIIAAVNLLILAVFGYADLPDADFLSRDFLRRHADILIWTTLITGGIIGGASLSRSMALRSGGGAVAQQLGGTLVEPDTNDPLRRRLRNVVEEMAIASGVPVPEIYVLDKEEGINAFAAGYSPSDAAIAVTRGTLENLSRDELQGVVAHEFAHILNGDMRLNIRLIGLLFGILVMTVIGRRVMFSMRYSGRNRNAGGIVALALALMLIGYIGLFFGRMIKASVSRQRELLADASAVQFTRQPEGIAGALKKIGATQAGSVLETDTEEVGHMLFGRGMSSQLFATHPPLVARIRAIEPGFDPKEFERVRERMQRHAEASRAAAEQQAAPETGRPRGPGGKLLEPGELIEQIGRPGFGQVVAAALLAAAIPRPLERAAHSSEWAPEVLCYLLMDPDAEIRQKQMLMVAEALGAESERQVRALLQAQPALPEEQRLPLLEITFPALRRRPEPELRRLIALIGRLIHADGRLDVFEYVLARVVTRQLEDALQPASTRIAGKRRLSDCVSETRDLFRILAHHGHPDAGQAVAAMSAGLDAIGMSPDDTGPLTRQWPQRLDAALEQLNELKLDEKRRLLEAMVVLITHSGETVIAEIELMRAVCAALHVPLPVMASG
jgi:Zn-dependent protease with chaperone function